MYLKRDREKEKAKREREKEREKQREREEEEEHQNHDSLAEKLFIEETQLILHDQLGEGSYGTVWAGECLKKPVAVKLVKNTSADGLSVEQFKELQNEVRRMTESLHENIMLPMGLSIYQGKLAIVMELLDGDLEKLLINVPTPSTDRKQQVHQSPTMASSPRSSHRRKKETFSLYQRLMMAKDAALGMNWLHSRDPAIIHRDLKLANLMYKKTGDKFVIKIADFGLAVVKPSHKKSLRGELKGTPLIMAPELMKQKPYTEKADVYSFGLCLWQIITCEPLFPEFKDYSEFERAICKQGQRPRIPESIEFNHKELAQLLECSWAAEPKHRPDFHAIILRLEEILVDVAIDDPRGREFWKDSFLCETGDIPWDKFWYELSLWLGLRRNEELNRLGEICFKALIQDCHKDKRTEMVNIESFGNFLKWYGPLDPKGRGDRLVEDETDASFFIDGDRRTACSMVYRLNRLLRCPWFHGLIEHDDSVRKLESKEPDTFLVRCSGTLPGYFAISRTVEEGQNKIVSTRLGQSRNGFGESTNTASSGKMAVPTEYTSLKPTTRPDSPQPQQPQHSTTHATTASPSGGGGRGSLRNSSDIIQMKRFESLPQLINAILHELSTWKACPGSPFSFLFSQDDHDPYKGAYDADWPYRPLPMIATLEKKPNSPIPGSPLKRGQHATET